MLGTDMRTMGGIAMVAQVYQRAGFMERCGVRYLPTHCDGSWLEKIGVAARALATFSAAVARGKVALLHVHSSQRASFWRKSLFLLPAFVSRIPTILHLHGSEFVRFHDQECGPTSRWFVHWVFSRASRMVVLSESWGRWVREVAPDARVTCLYNPVALPAAVPDFDLRKPHLAVFLGRLGQRKGVYDLLEATARLAPRFPQLRVALAGDGEMREVEDRARELGIQGHVDVMGWVSGEAKERLLREAAVYVLPSYNEGLPMSVLEAMAVGLPVVSTAIAGIPDAVTDGVEGRLVTPGDVDALTGALHELLGDVETRRRMGKAAREKVRRTFSTEVVLPQLEALYGELLR